MSITQEKFNGGSIEEDVSASSIMLDFTLGRLKILRPTDKALVVYLKNAQLTPWAAGGIVYDIVNIGSYSIFVFDWQGNYTGIVIGPNQRGGISLANTSAEQGDLWRCNCTDLISGTTATSTTSTTSSTTTPPTTSTTSITTTNSTTTAAGTTGGGTLFTGTWGGGPESPEGPITDPRIDPDYTHLPIFEADPTPFGVLAPALPERRLPAALSVAVVVTTINEQSDLEMTLESLRERLRASDRIVVVDDGSIERIDARVLVPHSEHTANTYLVRSESRQGCAQARAMGARACEGADLVVFVDSHMQFPEHWLDEMLKAHAMHPNAVLCPISCDIDNETNQAPKQGGHWGTNADLYTHPEKGLTAHWAPINTSGRSTIMTPAMMGACYLVPTRVLRAIGGWSMGLRGWGFDEEFVCARAWMMGFEVRLVASTYAAHRYERSLPMKRIDGSGQEEPSWVLVYSRAYMNYVLFGRAVWYGSEQEIDAAKSEAEANANNWDRDREFVLRKRLLDGEGFWSLMNSVRRDANIQSYGGRRAHA